MSSLLDDESFQEPVPGPSKLSHTLSPAPAPAPVPIPSYSLRRVVGETETELLVQTFDDRILVIVTQNGKVGCLTQAQIPDVHPLQPPPRDTEDVEPTALSALPPAPPSLHLTPLLGSPPDPTLHDIYVSQIATLVWWSLQLISAPRRPVVVGLALKRRLNTDDDDDELELDHAERDRFAAIMDMVASWPGPIGST